MIKDGFKQSLPVLLTETELVEKAELQADAYKVYCAIEEEKKAANEGFKERMDDARKTMARLAHIVTTGSEPRMVLCRWIEDLDHNIKRLVRQDTGEVIKEEVIPAEERQAALPLDS